MAVTQYIGARYVPLLADPIDWDSSKQYEPLTIVYHQGNSFTSRKFVPTGIDITNGEYWVPTGNYNAQVEQYRREVHGFDDRITANAQAIADADTALGTRIDNESQARTDADTALGTRIDNETQERTDADTQIRTDFAAADAQIRTDLADLRNSVSKSDWSDASAGVYASRAGHIVVLTVRPKEEVTLVPMRNDLTTLPSGWRPSRSFGTVAMAGKNVYQLVVDPDGSVYIWSGYDEHSEYLRGNLTYCVD